MSITDTDVNMIKDKKRINLNCLCNKKRANKLAIKIIVEIFN